MKKSNVTSLKSVRARRAFVELATGSMESMLTVCGTRIEATPAEDGGIVLDLGAQRLMLSRSDTDALVEMIARVAARGRDA